MFKLKVALVTNWHLQCGNAQYGRDLRNELEKEFDVGVFDEPAKANEADVVVINWHPSRVTVSPQMVQDLQSKGMKVIVILQNSNERGYYAQQGDPCLVANAVVSHQEMKTNIPNLVVIPHGIPVVDGLDVVFPDSRLRIGIAGFPYAWKRFDLTARVAQELGGVSLLIAPTHDMGDTTTPIQNIVARYPTAEVVRDWLPVDDVVRRLSSCTLNIFWYQHMPPDDLSGQSGSVRLGIAAKRPLIVSKHPKLSSIREYTDEVYVAETEEDVAALARQIFLDQKVGMWVRKPKRLLEDMGWDKTGLMYRELIKKVAA